MGTLILLASSAEWEDAEDCRIEAENLWHLSPRFYPEAGPDQPFEETLAELRTSLDQLKAWQLEHQPNHELEDEEHEVAEAETETVGQSEDAAQRVVESMKAGPDGFAEVSKGGESAVSEVQPVNE